jgi:ABC-type branched-subunit amino acid transport system permease subunit
LAARSMGINNPIYKAVTFGVSGLYTGIAGGAERENAWPTDRTSSITFSLEPTAGAGQRVPPWQNHTDIGV